MQTAVWLTKLMCSTSVALARPGVWIRKLRKHNVTRTIMVGRVAKGRIFTPWRILRYLPDWRAFRIYYWRLRGKNKLKDSFLHALADELASGGIVLENSTMYCKEHLATEGVMTSGPLRQSVQDDIEFGWQMVKKLAELGHRSGNRGERKGGNRCRGNRRNGGND